MTVCTPVHAVTPDQISGLKLWMDASSGVTKDGSTAAIDGDTVQQWNDRSSGGYNATQATAGSRPTYKTNIMNGQPVLRFNGAQNMITSSFLDSSFNTNYTFFVVASKASTITNEVNTSNQAAVWYSGGIGSPTAYTSNLSPNSIIASQPDSALVTNPTLETFRYDGAMATIRFNDLEKVASASGNLGLSGALTIGSLSNNSFYLHGDIAEIIVYNSALTNTQLDQVDSYLLTKYGITASPLFIFDGDSQTIGQGSTGGLTYPAQTQTLLGISGTYQNIGVGSQTVADMSSNAPLNVDSEYSSVRTINIDTLLGGTNDLYFGADATTTYNRIVSYLQGRRTAGFKVIVNTILPRSNSGTPTSFETDRQTVNSLIRSNWPTFADGISDIASNSLIGPAGAELNTTYYADKVHLTNTGYGIIASYVTAAINQIMNPITVSSVLATPSATTATIAWTTNQTGSTKVNYGLDSSYGSSTSETDTSTRVLNHNTSLSNLVACTIYHFQSVSNDLNSNQTTSTDQIFTTTGCSGSAPEQNNNSSSSSNSSTTCTNTPPSAPSIFQIWATKNTATIHFVPSHGEQNTYTISYGSYNGAETYNVTFNYSDKSGAIPYTINALNPGTVYYFKVRANNGCMPGSWSNTLSLRTASAIGSTSKAYAYNSSGGTSATSSGLGGSCSQYTVLPGDSFWAIAQKLLGAGTKYLQLWDVNKARFPSLNYSSIIRTGWTLSVGC